MSGVTRPAFDDRERADVRRQLVSYQESAGFKSARALLQNIEATLGAPLGCDDRRLRRFLTDTNRTSDDVIEHLVRFLNIALAPYARLAEEMARYYTHADEEGAPAPHDIDKLRTVVAGTYHVFLKGRRKDSEWPNDHEWVPGTTLPPYEIPYSVLKLDAVPGAPYLSAFEEVGNPDGDRACSEQEAFSVAIGRFTGCVVIQKFGGSFVIVLRKMQDFDQPKLYIVGEKYPESHDSLVLTGALIERNRDEMSDVHGSSANVKMIRQAD